MKSVYQILRAPNGTYVVEIGDANEDAPSVLRVISGFKSEGEASQWIKADQRYVGAAR